MFWALSQTKGGNLRSVSVDPLTGHVVCARFHIVHLINNRSNRENVLQQNIKLPHTPHGDVWGFPKEAVGFYLSRMLEKASLTQFNVTMHSEDNLTSSKQDVQNITKRPPHFKSITVLGYIRIH